VTTIDKITNALHTSLEQVKVHENLILGFLDHTSMDHKHRGLFNDHLRCLDDYQESITRLQYMMSRGTFCRTHK